MSEATMAVRGKRGTAKYELVFNVDTEVKESTIVHFPLQVIFSSAFSTSSRIHILLS